MRIAKKHRDNIAGMINSIMVSERMVQSANERGDKDSARSWSNLAHEMTVALADLYGIELPGLNYSRLTVREEMLKRDIAA